MWAGFAKRGLGFSADQGSPFSVNDGTEAFDLPPACQNPPEINVSDIQLSATLNVGELLTETLVISNTGVSNLDWTITEGSPLVLGACGPAQSLDWVSAAPDNGTTVPGDSDDVSVVFDATTVAPGTYTGELCVASNDPLNSEVVVELDLTVEQTDYYIYLPAVHSEDGGPVAPPLNLLPLAGLILLPAVFIGRRAQKK
jgi:hypothetical protein